MFEKKPHAPSERMAGPSSATRITRLAITAHLLRSFFLEHATHRLQLVGPALHPDAEAPITEARIVADRLRDARNARIDEEPRNRRERSDQHHHLEADDRVRHPRRDRLSAHDARPVVRDPDRNPVAERHTNQRADQRVASHRARWRLEHVVELVARRRRIDGHVAHAKLLELLDRLDGRVQLGEHSDDSSHQSTSLAAIVPGVSLCPSRLRRDVACRMRGGTVSLISAIAMIGSCFTKSRNHIENQPKLPTRIAQSMCVGAYGPHRHGSNSCDSDGTMITKRSYHIPRLMKIESVKRNVVLRRSFCEKSRSGSTMLHVSMIQAAHHHWPKTLFMKYACSFSLPPYQAMKNSVRYAQPTTSDVKRQSFAAASRWLSVT